MTFLGDWLKHLILIVLISVIADLLLPTKAMQKYVRAVLGIAIIAAMIQPITPLFHRNWADEVANAAANELTQPTSQTGTSSTNSTLQGYQKQLEEQQKQEADGILADAVKEQMPVALREHIQRFTIRGAATPDKLHATIVIDTADKATALAILKQVAGLLHVQAAQVTVRAGGGE